MFVHAGNCATLKNESIPPAKSSLFTQGMLPTIPDFIRIAKRLPVQEESNHAKKPFVILTTKVQKVL